MGVDLSVVMEGLSNAFSLQNLIWMVVGVILGLIAGTLPGFSGGSMMAVVLPLIIVLPIDTMLITLAAIYAANVYSDSTAGILYNIPGGASGIPATIEGYQLNKKGRLVDAFSAQVGGSLVGAIIGFLVLILLVPSFLHFVRFFGSAERALLAVWALVFIASGVVTKQDPLRAFLSVGVGLAIALVGQQPNIGTFRFTFGMSGLWDGLKVVLLVLSLFAIPQLLTMISLRKEFASKRGMVVRVGFFALYKTMARVIVRARGIILRSSFVGVLIGIIPGIGTTTAAWAGYSIAQNSTREPEKFGEGNIDGVSGAEAASNACEVGTIIPLLALGIPGSAAAAIMLAALTLVGINPGPSMYANYGPQVWTIMFGVGLSGLAFTLLAYPFIVGAQYLSNLSVPLLVGAIGTLCVMGAYLQSHNLFGAYVIIALGVATVFGSMIGLKPSAVLIGFVLGPAIEKELIRAYQIGGFGRFMQPTALVILTIIGLTLLAAAVRSYKERRATLQSEASTPELLKSIEAELSEPSNSFLKEKLLAGLGIVFALGLLNATRSYPLFASLWIYLVAGAFIMVPALMLMFRRIGGFSQAWQAYLSGPKLAINWTAVREQAAVIAAFLGFIAIIPTLGFVLAAMLFVFALVIFFDRSIWRAVLAALGVTVMIYAVVEGFGIYVPQGVILRY
jgi:putative tricarboxylic transport membrane protein